MAKRFTDTEKWRDPWFCGLSNENKLFWSFLLDTCNMAGIWQVNWPLVRFYIPNFEFKDEIFDGRVKRLSADKWFIPKFIKFQYGELQPTNRLHQRLIYELKKEGVSTPLKHPSQGVKDKDMDMDMEKDKEKKGEQGETEIQKLVRGWKMLNDLPTEGPESVAWDKAHFARNSRSAKTLIDLFGFSEAVNCMEFVFTDLKKKKLDCTLETCVKRSDTFREQLARSGR